MGQQDLENLVSVLRKVLIFRTIERELAIQCTLDCPSDPDHDIATPSIVADACSTQLDASCLLQHACQIWMNRGGLGRSAVRPGFRPALYRHRPRWLEGLLPDLLAACSRIPGAEALASSGSRVERCLRLAGYTNIAVLRGATFLVDLGFGKAAQRQGDREGRNENPQPPGPGDWG